MFAPERIVHGDPKITNFLFAAEAEVVALVDLDTLGRMPLCLELGDAMRSWTNPAGDTISAPTFVLPHFASALAGYASEGTHLLGPARGEDVAKATLLIALELTVRFLRDALEERYFGWDEAAFARSAHHQLKRARLQLAYARALAAALPQATEAAGRAFN